MHQGRANLIAVVVCAAFLGGLIYVVSEYRGMRQEHVRQQAELARLPGLPEPEPEPAPRPERYVPPAPITYPIY